ncbi:MAG: S-adenosylmethionine decarboxylase [Cytophagales bacterium]|nr:MAG: S-adenosylmethionine decarboxylase [Cytophagales bacterium]TAF61754.1 MAG: S-adenosylmethionine decarboxylase [Cytophagales bacterium]
MIVALSEIPSAEVLQERFTQEKSWGLSTLLNLFGCNNHNISDKATIERYLIELCDLLKVTRFGDAQVIHFGKDPRIAGYSAFQLIETSAISGHFVEENNTAYIDIFSCKYYDYNIAASFTKEFFGAERCEISVYLR